MVTMKDKFSSGAHCPKVSLRPQEQKTEKELETTPNIIKTISDS